MQGKVVAGIVIDQPGHQNGAVVFTDESGQIVDGYRTDPTATAYTSGSTGVGPTRYGVEICSLDYDNQKANCGGVLASPGAKPVLFSLPPNLVGAPGPVPMGEQVWVWNWALPFFVSSVSNIDGSGYDVFLKTSTGGPVKEIGDVVTDGKLFFIHQYFVPDSGQLIWNIAVSDGLSDPKPYISPTDGSWVAMPGYAHSHFAWMRGFNPTAINKFETVELWESPYSADPAGLKPEKVEDWTETNMEPWVYAAGYGHYGVPRLVPGSSDILEEVIWDLATKEKRRISFPAGLVPVNSVGMTQTHLWVMAAQQKGTSRALLRFSVK